MTLALYDASVPVLISGLTNMRGWLDKADPAREAELVAARLHADMKPLAAQFQIASDTAKNAVARLSGTVAPAMADTETSFAELCDRCDRTIAYVQGVDRALFDGAEDRTIELRFPQGVGYRFDGRGYLTGFVLPNFFFHVTTAYAVLRAQGVPLGKLDFLAHIGAPAPLADARA